MKRNYGYSGSDQFHPISPWGYVGYTILYSLPIIGFLFLLIFTFSRGNINRRNFARSYWCFIILAVIIATIFITLIILNKDSDTSLRNGFRDRIYTFLTDVLQLDNSREDEKPTGSSLNIKQVSNQDVSDSSYSLTTGVSPEFKAAMDSYETFINKYIEFMVKYKNSNNSVSMLTEYMNYMTQYIEVMEKVDEINEEQLSDADTIYYLEVNTRIYKKLAEVE